MPSEDITRTLKESHNRRRAMLPKTDNCCTEMGWEFYQADYNGGDLLISVAPETDLDSTFMAFCHDEQEMIKVNGWNFTYTRIYE